MAPIRKFSLSYVASEDRIAFDAEDESGGVTRLWLTQRFCRHFVPAVIARLPKPAGAAAPEHAAAAQSFAQSAAMAAFGKTAGVTVGAETTVGRVDKVHIRPNPAGLALEFEFGEGQSRQVNLPDAAARQMLSVLHRLHLAAEWPADFWPAWVAAPAAATDEATLN